MSYRTVTVERHGHVAELRLDRPDRLNAFDDELVNELPGVLTDLTRDTEVRAVAWTSTGRHFSAGGDMETILAGYADLNVLLRGVDDGRRLFRAFADFPKPLVTAVQGSSFGVATSLVFTSDAVVVAPKTKLSDPHVHMGLVAGDGGAVTWPLSAGLARAKRKLLWGEPLTGPEAVELGLATDLVESDEQLRPRALELAGQVGSLPPIATQLTKRALNRVLSQQTDQVLDAGFYLEALSNRSDDVVEAVNSFKEKRPGNWSGT
ncbi:enoyl-CoA hydratase/isomerase family protein [Gordonia alkanivorans]|uniref:enoyl-CoA hydratase/isomerase family protein n=1 Tax=Gordonia alkanivorans TaxID=84096 RepID=UPI0024B80209|nr:enoyl-CoA hydratase/isomerase family protein [Gordonia alkanivorans]MDJ0006406.1 enoyl-CoA hydratase/isomerase family protein [Gordonia alkanivorans]MDJ0097087.1 enoyl-CoA hydratase/isomerase family protein [Gordonia alkanivorans]MDJ0492034.1 enoyl-CoA hydratase/isomerase family protein [Gordonia alkanivorans]